MTPCLAGKKKEATTFSSLGHRKRKQCDVRVGMGCAWALDRSRYNRLQSGGI